jgi:hypothetical protein
MATRWRAMSCYPKLTNVLQNTHSISRYLNSNGTLFVTLRFNEQAVRVTKGMRDLKVRDRINLVFRASSTDF